MPIFTYKCRRCGVTLDKLQKPSDPPPVCPAHPIHGETDKQLTTPGFQVKGAYSGKMY